MGLDIYIGVGWETGKERNKRNGKEQKGEIILKT